MQGRWKEYENMREEQRKCVNLFSVWLIIKDGKKRGVIMSRRAAHGNSSFVTIEMTPKKYSTVSCVNGYAHVRGLVHSECTREGIAKILIRHRETLKTYYGMDIPANERYLEAPDGWEGFMSISGYDVIKAV